MSGRFAVAVVLATLAVAALVWNAGELHRQNCIRDGHRACSVLPWDSGKPKPRRVAVPSDPLDPPTVEELLAP